MSEDSRKTSIPPSPSLTQINMARTATALRDEVRFEIGNPSTTAIADPVIDSRVDDSYMEILTRYRHPEIEGVDTFVTVAGTATYDIPTIATDYWFAQSMVDTDNDIKLEYKDISFIEDITETEGLSLYYTRFGNNFILKPVPNGAYTIRLRYMTKVARMAGAGSTIFDMDAWDEIVKWGAVWRMFQAMGEQDRMVHTRNIWRTLTNSMPESRTMESERSILRITPTGNDGERRY